MRYLNGLIRSCCNGRRIDPVLVDGNEHRLLDADGKTFQRRSVSHVREALQEVAVAKMTLRQTSAYDEMIGVA